MDVLAKWPGSRSIPTSGSRDRPAILSRYLDQVLMIPRCFEDYGFLPVLMSATFPLHSFRKHLKHQIQMLRGQSRWVHGGKVVNLRYPRGKTKV